MSNVVEYTQNVICFYKFCRKNKLVAVFVVW